MSDTFTSLTNQILELSQDRELHSFSYYWESCRDIIAQRYNLENEALQLHQSLVNLQLKLDRLDADLQLTITQDKRFTNETQRKAALHSLRASCEEWVSLTTEKIPQTKQALEGLKLQSSALQSVYNLCYIALSKMSK